jgi:hypothetical protein
MDNRNHAGCDLELKRPFTNLHPMTFERGSFAPGEIPGYFFLNYGADQRTGKKLHNHFQVFLLDT